MTETLHKASQYLCAAAKSYLEHKADDSHTSLEWLPELQALVTHPLGAFGDYQLALNFSSFSLEFLDANMDVVDSLYLENAQHVSIVNWIGETAMNLEIGELYTFDLHYELPYDNFGEDYIIPEPDWNEIERLGDLRTLANESIAYTLEVFGIEAPIRVWPHHFDTGAVIALNKDATRSVGLGMAIADSMVPEDYFYVSAWSHDESLALVDMEPLPVGKWLFPKWNGAVLTASNASEKEVLTFLLIAAQSIEERSQLV
jgi:hypothetical protein